MVKYYTIAQLIGARYKAHANDLIGGVYKILAVRESEINFELDEFQSRERRFIASPNAFCKPIPEKPVENPIEKLLKLQRLNFAVIVELLLTRMLCSALTVVQKEHKYNL